MKRIVYSVLACAAAVGCSSNLVDEVPVAHPYDIQISSGVEASATSKAAVVGTVDDLAGITFLQIDGVAETIPATNFTGAKSFLGNREKGAVSPIVFTSDPAPRYLLEDEYAFLKAYYPAGTLDLEVVTWPIDGKTDILISDGVLAAGKYSAPANNNVHSMTFKHVLAQLEVVCVAAGSVDVAESVTQDTWGTITSIELKAAVPSFTYTYATDVVAGAGTPEVLPLLQADYNTAFAAGVVLTKIPSPAITAAGMFVPAATGTAPLTLIVKTSKVTAGVEVAVQLKDATDASAGFEKGLCHKVTLEFKALGKDIEVLATTIDTWKSGYAGSGILEK